MTEVKAYAAPEAGAKLKPITIERRKIGDDDVEIDIKYCGVCHTDIHFVNNSLGISSYPLVPGHEIIGEVISVGKNVKKFKIGDTAAVGCFVDSCRTCDSCKQDEEQYCYNMASLTYGSPTKDPGGFTYGGYSKKIVVTQDFVLLVPENLDKAAAAPLLCAGITTYAPLKRYNIQAGMTVGVVGLGGLGHMAMKFALAMGAKLVAITSSEKKAKSLISSGAHEVIISTNQDSMKKWTGSLDFIINTIPVGHDVNPYLQLLKIGSTMCCVGCLESFTNVNGLSLNFARKSISGSAVGGIKETQEMLDFCGKNNITSDIELIKMDYINEAFKRIRNNDVKYRFVIDMESL